MKKFLIILSILIVVAASGYLIYKKWFINPEVSLWKLLPSSAILVYESVDPASSWDKISSHALWNNLSQTPFYQHTKESIDQFDSLLGEKDSFISAFSQKDMLLSLHLTGQDAFAGLFLFKLGKGKEQQTVKQLVRKLKEKKDWEVKSRFYQGFEIWEVKSMLSEKLFSYTVFYDYMIASDAAVLVEDVIRNINDKREDSFERKTLSAISSSGGQENIYLNFRKFPQFLKAFARYKDADPALKQMADFCESMLLELKLNEKYILLNGFSFTEKQEEGASYLNTFRQQKPWPLSLKHYLPQRTAMLYHITFDDPVSWERALYHYWEQKIPEQLDKRKEISEAYGIDVSQFFSWFGHEIGLSTLEAVDGANPDKLLLIQVKNREKALSQLDKLSALSSTRRGDTLYREDFGEETIRELAIKNFPEKLLGSLYAGYEQCFYAPIDDYIVFSNKIQEIKNLIQDIEEENTWGRSIKQNVFLENSLSEANVTLLINTSKIWKQLEDIVSPKWRQFMGLYSDEIQSFELISVQLGHMDDNFYTALAIKHKKMASQPSQSAPKLTNIQNLLLDAPAITKPFVVRNHVNNSLEVVLQDSLHQVYLISTGGNILWKKALNDPLIGDIRQIDFYRNGKLQYFFTTENAIYIIDRKGNFVENYPLKMPEEVLIRNASIIDYDNSKRYRFLVADIEGNLYMFNKEQENLQGWAPRALKHRLASNPTHARVRGKDCMIAIQENGIINIMNRRGEMYKGFPLDLKASLSNPVFIEIGANFQTTTFTTITDNGEIIKFNLLGEIVKREQLYKPLKESVFRLSIDRLGRTYMITRQDLNKISLLDQEGKELFFQDYTNIKDPETQYYHFGSGIDLMAITNENEQLTYLYNNQGKLVTATPIKSGYRIGLIYSDQRSEFKVYHTAKERFFISSFKIP